MKRQLRQILSALLAGGASLVQGAPGPWKVVSFPPEAGVVTSVAIRDGRIAVGFSSGGARILDRRLAVVGFPRTPALGPASNVLSVAWSGDVPWIATRSGLFRYDPAADRVEKIAAGWTEAMGKEVRAMRGRGDEILLASARRVVRMTAAKAGPEGSWAFPNETSPTSLLRVAGRVLVGTDDQGLLVLDTASRIWSRVGKREGLSGDQVTALEWVGDKVYVATPSGLDALDLGNLSVAPVLAGLAVNWMGQVQGVIHATTLDGLVRLEPGARTGNPVDLPKGLAAEGDLVFGDGILAVGCGRFLAVREQPTFLGTAPLRPDPAGFLAEIPKPLPATMKLLAWARLPEWAVAGVALEVLPGPDPRRAVLRVPAELRGKIQIDLAADFGGRPLEMRSFEVDGERRPPVLALDPLASATRDASLEISGKVDGTMPYSVELQPGSRRLAVGPDGAFRGKIELAPGANRLEVRFADAVGNRLSREIEVLRDDQPPVLVAPKTDTTSAAEARIRIPWRDAGLVSASVDPAGSARVGIRDSFLVLEASALRSGDNFWRISAVDRAGNRAVVRVGVFRRGGPDASGSPSAPDAPPCATDVGNAAGIRVIRYRMEKDETIRKVAEKFYGTRDLDTVLVVWNGFSDTGSWRRMPVGTPVEVPIWRNLEPGVDRVRELLGSFPWAAVPARRKEGR